MVLQDEPAPALSSATMPSRRAGVFKFLCHTHPESMIGEIVVLVRES